MRIIITKNYRPLILLILMLWATSCSRYEENEEALFSSPKSRLLGTWELRKMNNVEYPIEESIKGYMKDACGNYHQTKWESYSRLEIVFKKQNECIINTIGHFSYTLSDSTYYSCHYQEYYDDQSDKDRVIWRFIAAKNYLKIDDIYVEILKLTEDELVMTADGERYEYVKLW